MPMFTVILLSVVFLVMVVEQSQDIHLAHWISTTPIPSLVPVIPKWMGLWFSVFPTYETLIAQFIAAVLVIGSYYAARHFGGRPAIEEPVREAKAEAREAVAEELQPVH